MGGSRYPGIESPDATLTLPKGMSSDSQSEVFESGAVLGSYRVIRELGRGGMGIVYEVEHLHLKKLYALKALRCSAPGILERFKIEARVMADMHHPNIVRVHQMEVDADKNLCYFVMDYICGKAVENESGTTHSLADLIAAPGQRMSQARVKAVAVDICSALEYAHSFNRAGIVHRDIKPSNILIDENGQAYISDFGIAKILGDDYFRDISQQTHSLSIISGEGSDAVRSLLGTVEFMAPEQRNGGAVTAQTDIYAVGVILYRLLTGYMPTGAWKEPSACGIGCSHQWDGIVRRCLEHDLRKRYQSAGALKKDILKISRRSVPRSHLLVPVALAVITLLGAGIYYGVKGAKLAENDEGRIRRAADSPAATEQYALNLDHVREIRGVECRMVVGDTLRDLDAQEVPIEISVSLDRERWAVLNGVLRYQKESGLFSCNLNQTLQGRCLQIALADQRRFKGVHVKQLRAF